MAECFNGLTFVFNGKSSNLYGLYMGWRTAEEEWGTGLDREIVKGEMNISRHIPNLYGVTYADVLPLEFDIFHQDGSAFSQRESRDINNWLMQDSYKRFKVNDNNTDNVYYKVICTSIQDLTIGNFRGKHVVMTCDSPFAYTQEVVKKVDALISGDEKRNIVNSSDDGIYFPFITLECDAGYTGDVELINETEDKTMLIKMENIEAPIGGTTKTLNIDTQHMMITDIQGRLVPLYRIGWEINLDENKALQTTDLYWFRLLQGMNKIRIKGNVKASFVLSFPRKAGQINEE